MVITDIFANGDLAHKQPNCFVANANRPQIEFLH